mmetsp:Transcript_97719/g.209690  ORF Transcript_97719/g.209690 Transcript_97719/m.209690 type:complete len:517 (-) Transcript_97719:63-1613(-)
MPSNQEADSKGNEQEVNNFQPQDQRNQAAIPDNAKADTVKAFATLQSLSDVECGPSKESSPLIRRQGASDRRRSTTHLEGFGHWQVRRWTPELSHGQSKWWVLVLSAFANIGPGGCLVVSNPQGDLAGSLIVMTVFLGLSLFGAYLCSRALTISGTWTMASCWRSIIGPKTSFVPLLATSLTCFSCAIGYAEFYSHMLATVFYWTPIPTLLSEPEEFWSVLIALFPMSVLVCLKDISVMKPATALTMVSCTFTLVAVITRYFDGSYAPGGHWFHFRQAHVSSGNDDFFAKHAFFLKHHTMPVRLFTSQAVLFLCHFNAAKYFSELENPKTDRFTAGIGLAMGLGFMYCSGIMIFLNLTFGYRTTIITMDNYAPDDPLINVARVGLSLGVMGCYPLLFCGMREAAIEFLSDILPDNKRTFQKVIFQNSFSLVMLVVSVIIELCSERFSLLILRLGRTCFGTLLIYVIPVVLFVGASYKHMSRQSIGTWMMLSLGFMLCLGLGICAVAAVAWLRSGVS